MRALMALGVLSLSMGTAFAKQAAPQQEGNLLPYIPDSLYEANQRLSDDGQILALYGLNLPLLGASPRSMMEAFFQSDALGLDALRQTHISLEFLQTRSSRAGHNVHFRALNNDVPVYKGRVLAHISPSLNLRQLSVSYLGLSPLVQTQAKLSQNAAQELALRAIGAQGAIRALQAELVAYPLAERSHLAWQFNVVAEQPGGDWEVLIDAITGEELVRWDRAAYATGSVFDPDPLSSSQTAYGQPIADQDDADYPEIAEQVFVKDFRTLNTVRGLFALSSPWAELVDTEAPLNGFFTQSSPDFIFNREEQGFEASNVFWHIQESMRYINEDLGIALMPYQYEGGVRFDPHGVDGDDNSHYVTTIGEVAFCDGCVDDAEDADVIWHELGHGIHDWITAGGLSNILDGLSEGFGDYWAHSYSRSLNHWQPDTDEYHWVFNWDGHNECWGGRITNYDLPWPVGITPFPAIHTGGQIFSTCLMAIYDELGREKTDTMVLEGLAMTSTISSQNDAANSIYIAASDLEYPAEDLSLISQMLGSCGYIITEDLGISLPAPLGPQQRVAGTSQQSVATRSAPASTKGGAFGAWLAVLLLAGLGRRRWS